MSGSHDGHEMNGVNDVINMDDHKVGLTGPNIWLNYPKACIFVIFGTHERISLNICTWIHFVAMQK
jgi:hypothetical protein